MYCNEQAWTFEAYKSVDNLKYRKAYARSNNTGEEVPGGADILWPWVVEFYTNGRVGLHCVAGLHWISIRR